MKEKNVPVFGFIYDSDLDPNGNIEVYLYDQNGNIFLEGTLFGTKSRFSDFFKYNIKKYKLVKEITRGKVQPEHMIKHTIREYKVHEEEYETDKVFDINEFLAKKSEYFSNFRAACVTKEREDTTWEAYDTYTILVRDDVMTGRNISEGERNEIIAKLTKIGQEKFGLTEKDIKEALRFAPMLCV
jgi:hypothetical protein